LQYCVEAVEQLAILDHDPNIQYKKEGVFTPGKEGEFLYPVECRLSDVCLRSGITWDWFPDNWSFGNGVTIHKTLASPRYRTVVHGTELALDQFLALHGPTRLADLELHRLQNRHECWENYEARWLPGTCPKVNHVVHLTWLMTTHRLPQFAYQRIRQLIEDGAEPQNLHLYSKEPGKHFSGIRRYDGKPAHGGTHALPVI